MNAVSIGPFLFSAERFSVLLGMAVFLLVCWGLSRRVDGRFEAWSWWVVFAGAAAARLGHVAVYWRSFAEEPWRAFAFWQGGFFWPAAVAAVLALVLLGLKTQTQRLWAIAPLLAGLFVWNVAWQLAGGAPATPAPQAQFATLAGERYDLAAAGRPQVVNLWASWCPPCLREMPMMAEVAAQTEGADFVFANQGESGRVVQSYLDEAALDLETVVLDPVNQLSRHYDARGLPVTLFLGADGALRGLHVGEISREVLQARISELLAE